MRTRESEVRIGASGERLRGGDMRALQGHDSQSMAQAPYRFLSSR